MIIKYSKLRVLSMPLFSKDIILSTLKIDNNNDINKISIKNLLSFDIEFKGKDLDTIMKYMRFNGSYYILSAEKDRVTLFWGLKKVSGIKIYLIKKEGFDEEIKHSYEEEIENSYEKYENSYEEDEIVIPSKDEYLLRKLKEAVPSHIGFVSDNAKLFFLDPYQNYVNFKNEPIQVSSPTYVENLIK